MFLNLGNLFIYGPQIPKLIVWGILGVEVIFKMPSPFSHGSLWRVSVIQLSGYGRNVQMFWLLWATSVNCWSNPHSRTNSLLPVLMWGSGAGIGTGGSSSWSPTSVLWGILGQSLSVNPACSKKLLQYNKRQELFLTPLLAIGISIVVDLLIFVYWDEMQHCKLKTTSRMFCWW